MNSGGRRLRGRHTLRLVFNLDLLSKESKMAKKQAKPSEPLMCFRLSLYDYHAMEHLGTFHKESDAMDAAEKYTREELGFDHLGEWFRGSEDGITHDYQTFDVEGTDDTDIQYTYFLTDEPIL
mgnify:CR=1 FL=1